MIFTDDSTGRILLIDADARVAGLTARQLGAEGWRVAVETDAGRGLAATLDTRPDIVVLSAQIDDPEAAALCRALEGRCPVLLLCGPGVAPERWLELGAAGQLVRPFTQRELQGRVRAILRRLEARRGCPRTPLQAGRLVLEPQTQRAVLHEARLALTSGEFSVLYALAERVGAVLSREQLLEVVHGSAEEAFDRSIDVHISRLRRKLQDDPRRPRLLLTVRGAGYMLAREATLRPPPLTQGDNQ